MDDRMGAGSRGDSLLRKIDFKTDHFIATYGPNGDGVGQADRSPVPIPRSRGGSNKSLRRLRRLKPRSNARVPFTASGQPPRWTVTIRKMAPIIFAANNPADPNFKDSRSGSVVIDAPLPRIQ